MKRLVGISIGGLQKQYGDMRALEIAHEIGADAVDFNTSNSPWWDFQVPESPYAKSDEELVAYFSALKKRADELGLILSQTHGRLRGFRRNAEENRAILENARLDCLAAHTLGAPVCVVHSVATGLMGPDTSPEEMRDVNFAWFTSLLQYAKQYNVKIATETFGDSPKYGVCDFFGQIEEFEATYARICAEEDNARYMSVCIDTGHSNKAMRFGNPTPADVIRRMGPYVSTLHLNDNDTLTDQHKIPMTGCIDWADVFDALDEVGYTGVYNMELNLSHFGNDFQIETAAFAVKVMKHFLHTRYGNE
ncbi:MAG: sugar phosphate isomerase/epimerase [Clostridia bacterium]|nr:sugar phosphate isomerase/epimerase [Clostridia bacterium]